MRRKKHKLLNKFITINWYDACDINRDKDYFEYRDSLNEGTELLVKNKTYGKLLDIFPKVLAILRERSDDDTLELTIIPRGWIIEPKELKIKNQRLK